MKASCCKSLVQRRCSGFSGHKYEFFIFTYSERDQCILQLFFRLFRDRFVSVRFLTGTSFLWALLKIVLGRSASTKALPLWSGIAIPKVIKAIILINSFSAVNCLTMGKYISAYLFPATRNSSAPGIDRNTMPILLNMMALAVYTVAIAFTTFARAAAIGSVAQLVVPYL